MSIVDGSPFKNRPVNWYFRSTPSLRKSKPTVIPPSGHRLGSSDWLNRGKVWREGENYLRKRAALAKLGRESCRCAQHVESGALTATNFGGFRTERLLWKVLPVKCADGCHEQVSWVGESKIRVRQGWQVWTSGGQKSSAQLNIVFQQPISVAGTSKAWGFCTTENVLIGLK
jgi:hypothetical protein